MLRGLDQLMERKEGGGMYLLWVSLIGDVRTLMMDEAHASRYMVHPGADKTYYDDLRDMYGTHFIKSIERDRLMVIEVMVAMDISLWSHFSDNENDVMHVVILYCLTPLCCDDIHDVTPRVSPWWGVTHKYLNDLEEEYEARALLTKSKRFFKKDTQRFSSAKAKDQLNTTNVARRVILLTKDFKAKYNKVKAKLALLSSSASASKVATVKNKGLIAEAYEWDKEEVSSDDNEMVEVKVLMALAEENDAISKEGARNDPSSSGQKDLVFVKSLADDTKVSIPSVERPWLSKAEGFILPNHDIGKILLVASQRNTTDPSVAINDSSTTEYDSMNESLVCSTPLPPLKKLDGAEPISGPKTIK
ncbi:hypothetical protein Tco_0446677 [Tanacetum coccineum]